MNPISTSFLSSSLFLLASTTIASHIDDPKARRNQQRGEEEEGEEEEEEEEDDDDAVDESQETPQQSNLIIEPESRRQRHRLAFIKEGSPVEGRNGLPYYPWGQNVNISWTTPFARTSLNVYQRRQSGGYVVRTIAEGFPRNTTSVVWHAQTLTSDGDNDGFHFQLVNARNSQCNACSQNSNSFAVSQRSSASSSSSSSSSTATSSSTSTHSLISMHTTAGGGGGSPTSTTTSVTNTSASTSSAAATSNSARNLGVGLGVGLGVPALALLGIFLFFFFLRSRNNNKRSAYYCDISRPIVPGDDTAAGGVAVSTSAMALRSIPNPTTGAESETSKAPPRPSYAGGMSEFGGAAGSTHSEQSWFEPFDFERQAPDPERDETMSQLRQSIASRGSIRPSSDGLSFSNPGTVTCGGGSSSGGGRGGGSGELPPHALTTDEVGRI